MRKNISELHELKNRAHKAFDPLWQDGLMSRDEAYWWIQGRLSLPTEHAHISLLSAEELVWLIDAATCYYKEAKENIDWRVQMIEDRNRKHKRLKKLNHKRKRTRKHSK